MSDQHRGDCLSLERHPVLLTPNMDSIFGSGTHFRRAYATCPSCIPARRALLTGQYPETNGLMAFRDGYPIRSATLPGELRAAGYQTLLVGRTMHQYPPTARYGYDHMVLGSTYEENDEWADEVARLAPGSGGVKAAGMSYNGWSARPWHLDEQLHPTTWTVRRAGEQLRRHDETAPLFLHVSFYAPHPPLVPPSFYLDRYLAMDLPEPAMGDWVQPPAHEGLGVGLDAPRCQLTGEALRGAQAGYFGLINHLDDQLYWLMADFKTESRRQKRPWVILLSSDHGEMLGDHCYFRKCEPYEGSARVPLLIGGSPELGFNARQTNTSPVCLEDLMPTLLELAGRERPADLDGRSLVPLLRGEQPSVRQVLHGEHAPCYSKEQAHHYLTDGRYKYIWRPLDGAEQLFDLQEDPHELHDLGRTNPDLVAKWRQRLVDRLQRRPEGFVQAGKLVSGRPYTGYPAS